MTVERAGHAVLAAVLVCAAVEAASVLVATRVLGNGILYRPPKRSDLERYLDSRDPLLGWPGSGAAAWEGRDDSGSRFVPSFPDPDASPCVSLYGDSFTWGDEVDDEHAWGNVLAEMLHCRVSNFGVNGYGTDQAYLRFRSNERDDAPTVVLGVLSENVVRNVTRYLYFLYGTEPRGFKPRFVLDEGGNLELVPPPSASVEELAEMTRHPAERFEHDYLVPGGPTGTMPLHFPVTYVVLASFDSYRVRAKIAGRGFWDDFHQPDHPSRALELTTAILRAFRRDALARGKTPVVLLFPMELDLAFHQRTQRWVYQPLLDGLRDSGIASLNLGVPLAAALSGASPCELFTRCDGGHYNETANRVVAVAVREYLRGE